jgi:hypothetical protein
MPQQDPETGSLIHHAILFVPPPPPLEPQTVAKHEISRISRQSSQKLAPLSSKTQLFSLFGSTVVRLRVDSFSPEGAATSSLKSEISNLRSALGDPLRLHIHSGQLFSLFRSPVLGASPATGSPFPPRSKTQLFSLFRPPVLAAPSYSDSQLLCHRKLSLSHCLGIARLVTGYDERCSRKTLPFSTFCLPYDCAVL